MPSYPGYGISFPWAWANDVRAAGAAFPVIGFVLLVLRFVSRRRETFKIGMDELFAIIAWIFLLGMGIIFIYGANKQALGWRSPSDEQLTATSIRPFEKLVLQLEYAFCLLMVLALGFTKLSILWFFRKIFVTHRRTVWDWITRVLTALVVAWTVAFFFVYAFECGNKPAAFWAPLAERVKHCFPINGAIAQFEKACGISDLVLDALCLSLPFPIIWRLHLSLSQKASVTGIFAIGLMTVAASAARLVIWVQILETASDPREDPNLAVTLALHWGMIEAGLAFIASQLPALSQFFRHGPVQQMHSTLRRAISWISVRSGSTPPRSPSRLSDKEVLPIEDRPSWQLDDVEAMAGIHTSEQLFARPRSTLEMVMPTPPDRIAVRREISVTPDRGSGIYAASLRGTAGG